MSLFDDPPLRDFPDRAIRRLLMDPHNLRDLISDVAGELAAALDFDRTEVLDRAFLLEDWRRRESDLLFRVPFRTLEAAPPALVCVLVEHQSSPDLTMPLRMLLYAVLYWERQWKAWEEDHPRGRRLELTPVLPVVFHTGLEPWRTHRELAELFVGPPHLRPVAPHWPLLFWEMTEHPTASLLGSSSAWLRSLAVIRAEEEDPPTFESVFAEVLRRLESLGGSEEMRRKDLLWFVLSWALRRRPEMEKERIAAVAKVSQTDRVRQEEAETMAKSLGLTWEQAEEIRVAESAKQSQLRTRKEDLRALLEKRFGTLPDAVLQRIETATDAVRLKDGILQALEIDAPDELDL
jgi:Putative transposase, YhgA-like